MALLDPVQPGFQKLFIDGIEQSPARGGLNFTGGGVSISDDAPNNRKNISLSGSSGGGLAVVSVVASGTSAADTVELVGSRSVVVTRNLPSATAGQRVMYCDSGQLAGTWNVIIDAGAGTIINGTTASTFTMTTDGEVTELLCVSVGNWMVIR